MNDPEVPDLSRPRRVHVVAVGGAGMSAIATVLVEQGHTVSGSDLVASSTTDRLSVEGVEVRIGHDPANLGTAEMLVVSTAVGDDNVEVVEARRRGLPVLRRLGILSAFACRQPLLSVSGTHGKTTTTSMLAVALRGAGADPSHLIGAEVPALGGAAANGAGEWFVLEADESDGSFHAGPRAGALITNIEADHLEFWGGFPELLDAFASFLDGTDGPRVVCADDPDAAAIGDRYGATSYGTHVDADHRIVDVEFTRLQSRFGLRGPGTDVRVTLPVPGMHNVRNAAGALTLAAELGVDVLAAADALAGFSGAARRFERRGLVAGVEFVDDYAHLPTEVSAALAAGRSGGWDRVVAVFQPHRYSRTEALWREFADSFADADLLVLTEIYGAGEAPRPGITGRLLHDAVSSSPVGPQPHWCDDLDAVADLLATQLRPGDLCLSIGAGDVTTLADRVIARIDGSRSA